MANPTKIQGSLSLPSVDVITSLSTNTIGTIKSDGTFENISQANFLDSLGLSNPVADVTQTTLTGTTSETDLHSVTIPANTLVNNGDAIIWAGGITTTGGAVSATNTARLYVDGSVPLALTCPSITSVLTTRAPFNLMAVKAGTNLVDIFQFFSGLQNGGSFRNANTVVFQQAITLSSSFIIKLTGELGQTDGSITCGATRLTISKV